MNNSKNHIWTGLFIGIGLTVLGFFILQSARVMRFSNRYVNVKGLAEKEVKADVAIWPITFKEAGNNLSDLMRIVKKNKNIIVKFLKKQGFTDDEITVSPLATNDLTMDQYRTKPPQYRYITTTTITVYSHKVDAVRKAMGLVNELGQQNIAILPQNFDNKTQFLFTGLNKIKPGMVEEATANARKVAYKFAKDSGSKLGEIKSAYQGQFSITNRDSNTPYIKKVRVVVTMDYYLAD